jgi:hypothetical protein
MSEQPNPSPPNRAPMLSYDRPAAWYRHRRFVLLLLLIVAAGAGAWAWRRWGPIVQAQAAVLYWQSKCESYDADAGMPAVAQTPAEITALARNTNYSTRSVSNAWSRSTATVHRPTCYESFVAACVQLDRARGVMPGTPGPQSGTVVYNNQAWGSLPDESVVFLHERGTAKGVHRLVVVYAMERLSTATPPMLDDTVIAPGTINRRDRSGLIALCVEPAGFFNAAVPYTGPEEIAYLQQSKTTVANMPVNTRFRVGQPDRADPARFIIPYSFSGQSGTLAGTLGDDGAIEFTVKAGPISGLEFIKAE